MRLVDFLDKGASLGADAPCLVAGGHVMTYADVTAFSHVLARALARAGIAPGEKVAILSANDPIAFACVFGISRAGAVWCPINPRNGVDENRELLAAFDCRCLFYQQKFAPLVAQLDVPVTVCLETELAAFTQELSDAPLDVAPLDDVAMVVGTGGTTGRPKGVMLTGHNLEAMTALTLMGYPFVHRPVYLALAPLTHAAGVLCFPILTRGGRIVIMPAPDLGELLALIPLHRVTHLFLPPTLIYMLLADARLATTDLSSLVCFWYGAAPMSVQKLEEALVRIGPVMAQLFGQTEAPMMITTMAPAEHFRADGSIARERLASCGRPSPLTTVAILGDDGAVLPAGQRGEIVVRGPLVMAGYYQDEAATREASRFGWHHTGDIGYLDDDGYLFIVDRLKDMIISGGFNVYSAEVEQALMQHAAVQDCAVIGLPDEKWGERVVAVVQLRGEATADELIAFVKARIGSVKAPKQLEIWPDLPRSKVGKVLKSEIKQRF
ncbi:MAG TPA: long-chain fatty acid--CoA ligase [Kofleriaceae bacterium]|jgi:acyl-CoA synthetase (AMP-forming)/AMP-acid ligase II